MASIEYGIPGIGGSLGKCAVCGESFALEIMLHRSVDSIKVPGCEADLPVHSKCADLALSLQGPWAEIRDKFPEGPMKKAFDEACKE